MDSTIKSCEPLLRAPTSKRVNLPAINSIRIYSKLKFNVKRKESNKPFVFAG